LKVIWQLAPPEAKHGNILAIVAYPLIAVLYIANFARVVWADLGYGILVGVLGPLAVFKALA
jgi:nitrate reductase NapE component